MKATAKQLLLLVPKEKFTRDEKEMVNRFNADLNTKGCKLRIRYLGRKEGSKGREPDRRVLLTVQDMQEKDRYKKALREQKTPEAHRYRSLYVYPLCMLAEKKSPSKFEGSHTRKSYGLMMS